MAAGAEGRRVRRPELRPRDRRARARWRAAPGMADLRRPGRGARRGRGRADRRTPAPMADPDRPGPDPVGAPRDAVDRRALDRFAVARGRLSPRPRHAPPRRRVFVDGIAGRRRDERRQCRGPGTDGHAQPGHAHGAPGCDGAHGGAAGTRGGVPVAHRRRAAPHTRTGPVDGVADGGVRRGTRRAPSRGRDARGVDPRGPPLLAATFSTS